VITYEQAVKALKDSDGNKTAAGLLLGVSRNKITRTIKAGPNAKPRKLAGVSVDKFIERFDYVSNLADAIELLCQDCFVCDFEIRDASKIPVSKFRSVATNPEFKDNQIRDRGKVWWSTKANVKKVRDKQSKWGLAR
jgi:hypothetical protein